MKITHFINKETWETKEEEGSGFMLTNRDGDYLWMDKESKSRYQGWFAALKGNLFRIIEGIEVKGAEEVSGIKNNFYSMERMRNNLREFFFLPQSSHTLVYELSEKRKINVFFDTRESYSAESAMDYEVERINNLFLVKFKNGIFLAVRCEEGEPVKNQVERFYSYDENRNSQPFSRTVFHGLSLYGKHFVFSVAESKEEALREVEKLFVRNSLRKEGDLDVLCAEKALADLLVMRYPGLYAGLPWFFQFWPRDEAVSLYSLLQMEEEKAKAIFFRLLFSSMEKGPGGAINADAPGWVFKRAGDILHLLDREEKEKVRKGLKDCIEELLLGFTERGFALNKANETWMDSLERSGARIEIQAMRLYMYSLALQLSKKWRERRFYGKLEKEMKEKVRSVFWDGKNLFDGYYLFRDSVDRTIRPNIFIAAYIYPRLLSKKEWINCLDNALSHLWLPWGGVASLQKDSPQFHQKHTGEDARSYHCGDSWFYLNNLAAIVLYRTDKKRYASYIKKIMEASKRELMWKGVVGCHGEVSSAKEMQSRGCLNQAWSNAMYLEARREMKLTND